MGTILTGAQWKTLRKSAGLEKHAVKTHVAAKLDLYHKAKTTIDKLKAIENVELELQKFKRELAPGAKKAEFGKFIPEVDKILKAAAARRVLLTQRRADALNVEAVTIKGLLGGSVFAPNFIAFLKQENSTENWEFLIESRKAPKGKAAQKVYRTYCAPSAPKRINITAAILGTLAEIAGREDWDNMDFKPARKEVVTLLTSHTLHRWKKYRKDVFDKMA